MKNIALIAVATLGLAACQTTQTPMPTFAPVVAPKAQPVKLRDVKWKVYNAKGLEKLLAESKANGTEGSLVVMALTPQGYQNLNYNTAELERYIREQKEAVFFLETTLNERSNLTKPE